MANLKQPEPEITATKQPKRWYKLSLTTWIMIGLVLGGVLGYYKPAWGNAIYFLRDIFLNLIKSIIAPLVFSTHVVGIAGGGDLKKVGRMGAKALVYFEIVTTIALFIGLGVVNLVKPGVGVQLVASSTEIATKIGENHPKTLVNAPRVQVARGDAGAAGYRPKRARIT